jgi:hypothetical protein
LRHEGVLEVVSLVKNSVTSLGAGMPPPEWNLPTRIKFSAIFGESGGAWQGCKAKGDCGEKQGNGTTDVNIHNVSFG